MARHKHRPKEEKTFESRLFEILILKGVRALRDIPEDAPKCDWVVKGEKFKHVGNCPICLSRSNMSTETKFNIIKKGYGFITLKDGTEAYLPTVTSIVLLLEEYSNNNQFYFVDLVFTARGKKSKLQPNHMFLARMDRLSTDGTLTGSIAAIIRNAVEGENKLRVVSPFKEDSDGIRDQASGSEG